MKRIDRRHATTGIAAAGSALLIAPAVTLGAVATPRQTRGPFYPMALPADHDNDLVRVTGMDAQALGIVAHVSGRVLDGDGAPLTNALVEIWQCDAHGVYHHPRDGGGRDPGFQGYGRVMTDADGRYAFRTIKPVPYSGRTPHIHFAATPAGGRTLTTQLYVAGEPRNERDFVLGRITDPDQRANVVRPFEPVPEIETGALKARFDIRLG